MALLQLSSSTCQPAYAAGRSIELKLIISVSVISSMLTCESHELGADKSLGVNFAGGKPFVRNIFSYGFPFPSAQSYPNHRCFSQWKMRPLAVSALIFPVRHLPLWSVRQPFPRRARPLRPPKLVNPFCLLAVPLLETRFRPRQVTLRRPLLAEFLRPVLKAFQPCLPRMDPWPRVPPPLDRLTAATVLINLARR